jgi:hypothetical protein
MNTINNRGGYAVVYGLFVLMLATVAGTAILFMTQKDHIASADYAGSRTSSIAAMAALKAFEGQCSANPTLTYAILQKYINNHNCKWLFGANTTVDNTQELKIDLTANTNGPEYSARIVGFDSVNSYIVIEGIGYDGSGGKKKVLASYELGGLNLTTVYSIPGYGMYLGGSLTNSNAQINILGNVYLSMNGCGNCQHFNVGGTITGDLKTASTSNYLMIPSTGALTVTGKAFIRCPMEVQAVFRVNDKAGFEMGYNNFTSTIQLYGNSYFNQTANFGSANCVVGHTTNLVRYNSAISLDRFSTGFSARTSVTTTMSLADSLGMTSGDESPYTVTMPSWGSGVVKDVAAGTYQVSDVTSWWTSQQTAGKLYQDEWLILRLTGAITMNGNGTFYNRVIWLTNGYNINSYGTPGYATWYDCDDASNTMIYVTGTSVLDLWGVPNNKRFRGYIYFDSPNTSNLKLGGDNTVINGAICYKQGAFNLNAGKLNIVYNNGSLGQSALQEYIDLGIIAPPGMAGTTPKRLDLVDFKIRPNLLGVQL